MKQDCLSCRYHEDFAHFKPAITDCLDGVEGKHKAAVMTDDAPIPNFQKPSNHARVKYKKKHTQSFFTAAIAISPATLGASDGEIDERQGGELS